MAYVTPEIINKARADLKVLNKEYNMKATLSGKGGSSLRLSISEGSIDFIESYCKTILQKERLIDAEDYANSARQESYLQVNHYYLEESFDGKALEYLEKAKEVMTALHWDDSDVMTDYFSCAFYIDMRIGKWDKPYKLVR